MPKLKARLTKEAYEKLSATEREWYVAVDGGNAYVPDVEPSDGWGLENIAGLTSTVSALRKEKDDLDRKLKSGGPDAALQQQLEAVKSELEAIKKADPEGKANARLADAQKAWNQQFEKSKAEWESDKGKLRSALERRVRRDDLSSALASKKARGERLAYLVQLGEGRVRMVEGADGLFQAQVVKPDGSGVEYSKRQGNLQNPMTLDELADEMARDLPEMFQGHDARGTGSNNSSAGSSGGAPRQIKNSDIAAKSKFMAEIAKGEAVVIDG